MEFEIIGPYNYHHVIERLHFDPLHKISGNTIFVPLLIEGTKLIAEVTFKGDISQPSIVAKLPDGFEENGLRRIKEIFQLETSLLDIKTHFLHTDIASLFQQYEGMPLVCDFDLFGCLMKTIIHQQLNLSFAYSLTQRFVHQYGEEKDGVWFYPNAETVSQLDYDDLRKLQFSQRKAEYVIDTARLVANGSLNLEELYFLSDEEVIEKLVKIRGIGYWTAENILLFGLGRKNLFPIKDVGIQNAIKKLYDLDQKPSLEYLLTVSEAWAPYKSFASIYLWASLGNQKVRSGENENG